MFERIFRMKKYGSNTKTELLAGLTTFMTMAYIIALNPNLLTNFDTGSKLWNAVFLASCLSSTIACWCMAFLANKPIALAPGMGLNNFFALIVANIASLTGTSYVAGFQATLVLVLIEGLVFIVLSLLNVREKIVDAIPLGIRLGISPAIGLMLINIGLGSNAGIYSETGGPFYVMHDFFGALTPSVAKTAMGSGYPTMVLTVVTMFLGLFIIALLARKGVRGAVLTGMLISAIIYWAGQAIFLGQNPFTALASASFKPPFKDMFEVTFFKFNFSVLLEAGWFTVITLVITLCIIDIFDTLGTLIGAATRSGMIDENGKMENMKQALFSDAIGTVVGSCLGTSTVTSYVESAAGVEVGGRTGLTSATCGLLFLACIFLAPIAAIIPPAATSAALIYVGILMMNGLKKVNFDDIDQLLPIGLMLIAMPISGSIGHAIGIGLITDTILKLFSGRAKQISILTAVISILFLLKFFFVA